MAFAIMTDMQLKTVGRFKFISALLFGFLYVEYWQVYFACVLICTFRNMKIYDWFFCT